METTKHKLPEDVQKFLKNLKHYLNKPLYFYGSIQRYDYFNGSDVDIDIFTDNESSTIDKISHYLNIPKHSFKKTISKYNKDYSIIYGHKIMYNTGNLSIPIEFSIYNEKNKNQVLYQHNSKIDIPFYVSFLLIILKKCYYNFHLIDQKSYSNVKHILLSTFLGKTNDYFIKI